MKANKIIKPASVAIVELQNDMIKLINDSNLPAFAIEPILKELWLESKATVQKQYEADKKIYEDSLNESK